MCYFGRYGNPIKRSVRCILFFFFPLHLLLQIVYPKFQSHFYREDLVVPLFDSRHPRAVIIQSYFRNFYICNNYIALLGQKILRGYINLERFTGRFNQTFVRLSHFVYWLRHDYKISYLHCTVDSSYEYCRIGHVPYENLGQGSPFLDRLRDQRETDLSTTRQRPT